MRVPDADASTPEKSAAALTAPARSALTRRGLRLKYATLAWNLVGVAVVATAAWRARSVALAGSASTR